MACSADPLRPSRRIARPVKRYHGPMTTPPDFDLTRTVSRFLDGTRTASLATVDDAGRPHAANIQFVRGDGLVLYWVSSPDSEHSRHLLARPAAAVTVYAHDDTAANIHGLQMRGRAEPVADANTAWDLYTRKFPVVTTMPQVREMVDAGKQGFYRFTPTWLRWIDNRRGFGWKIEQAL